MRYEFLVETYETERIKVISAWSMFRDQDLSVRPHPTDARGRSVHEHMVHQCVSEDIWFRTMLDIDVGARPLPKDEIRLEFMAAVRGRQRKAPRRAARQERDVVGRGDDLFRRAAVAGLGYDSPHDTHLPSSGPTIGLTSYARP